MNELTEINTRLSRIEQKFEDFLKVDLEQNINFCSDLKAIKTLINAWNLTYVSKHKECPENETEIKRIIFDVVKEEPAELVRVIEKTINTHDSKIKKSLTIPIWVFGSILTILVGWKTLNSQDTEKIAKQVLKEITINQNFKK
jgi:hypothetical protein